MTISNKGRFCAKGYTQELQAAVRSLAIVVRWQLQPVKDQSSIVALSDHITLRQRQSHGARRLLGLT